MTQKPSSIGHLTALVTILIWGTTFVSTKLLLNTFTPVEILFIRFVIGYIALLLFYPKLLKIDNKQHEWLFMAAGISGITLYYLLENMALTFTTASNVGIIITIAPFFTALLASWLLTSEKKPQLTFYIGFLIALCGVILISHHSSRILELNPVGDLLAVLAAIAWAIYAILTRKISQLNYHPIQATRHTFFYGLLFMLPILLLMGIRFDTTDLITPVNRTNILFLGLGASALCFVTWNIAVKLLGAVKTSVYIYLAPLITVTTSVFILSEPLTPTLITGALLTLLGLWLSETNFFEKITNRQSKKTSSS